jgi:hypothetical protein
MIESTARPVAVRPPSTTTVGAASDGDARVWTDTPGPTRDAGIPPRPAPLGGNHVGDRNAPAGATTDRQTRSATRTRGEDAETASNDD